MAKHRTNRRSHKHFPRPASGVRPFWSGTISFGLVSVPVQLFPGNRPGGVRLRMLSSDGAPLARRYFCPKHERDVHPEHLLRGFEVSEGEYVVVTEEELEAAEPKKTREIDLRSFVDISEISPLLFERSYFLTPTGDTNKAYRLLAEVIEESGKVGIATFVMRDREYLIAILARNGILRAETLRFADEIRSPEDMGLPEKERISRADVTKFERLIKKQLADKLDESLLTDEYAASVRKLAEKKQHAHKDIVHLETPAREDDVEEEVEPTPDLLESIRRSLLQADGKKAKRAADNAHGDERSKEELYDEAKKLEIPNRSKLSKRQLARAIERAHSQA